MTVGSRLKMLREQANINQTDIAKRLGIAQSTYSQYESDSRKLPDDLKIKIGDIYNISIDYLLGITDEPTPPISTGSKYSKENLLAGFSEEDKKQVADYIQFLKDRKK